MRTGLMRLYGKKDTVQEYVDVVIKHFKLSKEVRDTALTTHNYLAMKTSFRGLAPSMQAMTLVNLVNEAYERLSHADVKYCFSIDMASLKSH
jgi:hypothetical protein